MRTTNLLLHERQLIEVASEEVHLALLSLRVGVLENVLVLLLRLIERDLELDDLRRPQRSAPELDPQQRHQLTFSHRFCRSRIKLFFIVSNSAS